MLRTILFLIYALDIILLGIYGFNIIYMIIKSRGAYIKKSKKKYPFKGLQIQRLQSYPTVTVQLPLFNERYVAERIIRASAAIDYPKDSLEIQVLDDSTDETLEISKHVVEELRREGHRISLIHREQRTGQKGGALREALERCSGEYIAVFDADFIPAPEILQASLPRFFADQKVGVVQSRWGHLNTEHSGLTKAQSLAMDGHFAVEQTGRQAAKFFLNFNGTAGVWRKACIYDAGNWQDDTLTEDLDLSYRAELEGWKVAYLNDVVNPSELPVQINAYKSQQFRWAKGSIQTALKLVGRILKSRLSWKIKLQAFLHLSYYSVHPLLVLNILLSLPLLFGIFTFNNIENHLLYIFASIFSCVTFAPVIFCLYSQYVLYKDWKRRICWIPFMLLLGTGVAINNTRAFLEAIFQKKSDFIRTPKFGNGDNHNFWKKRHYKTRFSFLSPAEFGIIIYITIAILYAVHTRSFIILPYLIYYLASFGYVFVLSLIHASGPSGKKQVKNLYSPLNSRLEHAYDD